MPETQRRKRSRADWEQLMTRYEASEVSQRAFCTQHGLAYSSFCYWRKQLRTAVSAGVPALVELPMGDSSAMPSWRVELDLGRGVVLRLR
jgi:transposase-like protein